MVRGLFLAKRGGEAYYGRNGSFLFPLGAVMVTRILNPAAFVLAIGCAAFLPGQVLAQDEGPKTIQLRPDAGGKDVNAESRVSSLAPHAPHPIPKASKALATTLT